MANDSVIIRIDANDKAFKDSISNLGKTTSNAMKSTVMAIGAVGTALSGLGLAAIKIGSEFEAGMSRVQAISGATKVELAELSAQAMQLGADTAFSAREASAGMENLASAGFNTIEIMSAMPGLLDLAAVSGGDVAAASDVAASALRGFGLEASQAGHVANIFARAAADTNAEALDMGEAMKYIAPVAHAMGLSIEETAAAIGIMADAGVKGSQAGTTLRAALSRLAKPTKPMRDLMQELGLSFYDAAGNMISLQDQVIMLDDKLGGLTQQQRNNALVTLYGQESLSGMIALIDAGAPKLDNLTKSLINSDGAAADMALTIQDNLNGQIEQLGGALETLAIKFYNSIDTPLKDVAKSANVMIDDLISAFDKGGFEGLVTGLGDALSNVATGISNNAPKMINAAVDLIEAFLNGIDKNSSTIANGAAKIVKALSDGLMKIIPKVIEIGSKIISEFAKSMGNTVPILKPITNIIQLLSNNLKTLLPIVISVVAAIKTFSVVSTIVGFVSKLITLWQLSTTTLTAYTAAIAANSAMEVRGISITGLLTATLSVKDILIGVLTAKIPILTAVTTLWGMAVQFATGHIGLMVALGVALVAGIVALVAVMQKVSPEEEARKQRLSELSAATEALTEKTKQNEDAYKSSLESIESGTQAKLIELENTKSLADELFTLVDANGQVSDANKTRAEYLLGTLNNALGTEYTLTDLLSGSLQQLKQDIDAVILAEQARIVTAAYAEEYESAIKREIAAKKEASTAEQSLSEQREILNRIIQEYIKYTTESYNSTITAEQAVELLTTASHGLWSEGQSLSDQYKETNKQLQKNIDFITISGQATKDRENAQKIWDDALRKSTSGEKAQIEEVANARSISDKARAEALGKAESELLPLIQANNKKIADAEKNRNEATTEAEKQGWQNIIDQAIIDGAALVEQYINTGGQTLDGLIRGLTDPAKLAQIAQSGKAAGIAYEEAYKQEMDIHSPSRVMKDLADDTTDGLINRLDERTKDLVLVARNQGEVLTENTRIYLEEKQRLENEAFDREYNERISNAKTAEDREKIKQDYILKAQEDGQKKYLDLLKTAADNEIKIAKETADKLVAQQEQEFSDLERQYRRKLITEEDYFQGLEKLRDKYFEIGSHKYEKYTDDIISYNLKIIEEQKSTITKLYDDMSSQAIKSLDKIKSSQDALASKLKGYGKLYEETTTTFKGMGPGLVFEDGAWVQKDDLVIQKTALSNLQEQNAELKAYSQMLADIQTKGALPPEFFDELRDMPIEEQIKFGTALLEAPQEEFNEYIRQYKINQELIQGIAETAYADDRTRAKEEADKTMEELGTSFLQGGKNSALNFGEGFMLELQKVMEKAKLTISQSLAAISPQVSYAGVGSGVGTSSIINNSPTYVLQSSGETTREQLARIAAQEAIKMQRG